MKINEKSTSESLRGQKLKIFPTHPLEVGHDQARNWLHVHEVALPPPEQANAATKRWDGRAKKTTNKAEGWMMTLHHGFTWSNTGAREKAFVAARTSSVVVRSTLHIYHPILPLRKLLSIIAFYSDLGRDLLTR